MKRQPTPDILGALLGGAAPVAPPPTQPARELLHTWQQGDEADQRATLDAIQPPAPPARLTALDAAGLTPATYRTAVRLVARAEPSGVLFVAPEEGLDVFGVAEYGAQRAHLYHLKRAGLIDYARSEGWFVRLLAPIRALALQNRAGSGGEPLQNRAPTLQIRAESDDVAELQLPNRAPTLQIRADDGGEPLQNRAENAEPLQNGALTLQNRAPTLQNRAESALLASKSVSKYSESDTKLTSLLAPAPELPPQPADPVGAAVGLGLLAAAGIDRQSAFRFSRVHSLEHVRRAVGHWWDNRRSNGGRFKDEPGIVLTWLDDPDRFPQPPCSREFQLSELYGQHLTPAERAALYPEPDEEPLPDEEPVQPTRIADDDAQVEPPAGAPTGFDPARLWLEFAARSERFSETRLAAYDPETGEATVTAPAENLSWLTTPQAASAVRRQASSLFGRPVFVAFVEVQP